MAPDVDYARAIERDLLEAMQAGWKLATAPPGEEVCITGVAGIFPDCDNVHQLRDNLLNKRNLVTPERLRWNLSHPEIPESTGKINNLEKFDAAFFGVHFKQAHSMDPLSRVLLEKSYEAIVDAGLNPSELKGTKTGVFIGSCFSESEKTCLFETKPPHGFGLTGCSRPMLANRISYWLGINGPSYTVDTACSSSLYAIEHAYKAIREGLCDQALVGGANLCLHPYVTLQFSRLGVLSPQGRCKTFDEQANGYARSEAIGVMLLQKSRDARRIYATIVHTKTNSDGYKAQGITYPSGQMQQKLLEEFYEECKVDPATLDWVEAHGTGTRVGDPEELNALDAVFCKGRSIPLPVGSVKSNIGHTEPASGFCSVCKVIVSMEAGLIPPNLHFESPRKEVAALVNGDLQVVTEPQSWNRGLVGINSFGFGGSNCHLLLKSNTNTKSDGGTPRDKIPRLVTISSRTEKGVQRILDDLESRPTDAEYVNLYHHIHALNIPGHIYRGFTLLKQGPIRDVQFYSGKQPPEVWFVLSGLGGQWTGMGRSLLAIPAFATSINKCHQTLKPFGLDLRRIVTDDKFDDLIHTSVGITAVQIGLVDVLNTVGIHPDGLLGHSVGDLAAGYADKCFTMEQTIVAAYYRGLALLETDLVKGAMACISLGQSELKAVLPQDVQVACQNGATSCIVSGPRKSVTTLQNSLTAMGVEVKEVEFNNVAAHSQCVASVGPKLIKYLQRVFPSPKARSAKWISSSVPKTQWTTGEARLGSAEYLTNNFLEPDLFHNALALIPSGAIVIEISPDTILQGVLGMPDKYINPMPLMENQLDNTEHLLITLGKLYECGLQPRLANLYPPVTHPVSRATPMIAPLLEWEHTHDWFVPSFTLKESFTSGEKKIVINTSKEYMAFYTGHVIDGRNLFPATGYLVLVWEALANTQGISYLQTYVVFEDVRFHRATNIPKDGLISFIVLVQKASGNFEIVEGGATIVTGRIYFMDEPATKTVHFSAPKTVKGTDIVDLSSKDIYKELRLRGYNYSGLFKSIISADNLGVTGKIRWHDNWVVFVDNMLQMQILTEDTRCLFVPTSISKLTIDGTWHLAMAQAMEERDQEKVFDVSVHREVGIIRSGGVEIHGLKASAISRRKPLGEPVVEKYHFVPNNESIQSGHSPSDVLEALRLCIHLALENHFGIQVKVVELVDSHTDAEKMMPVLAPGVVAILGDLPLIQADVTVLTKVDASLVADLGAGINVEDTSLSAHENALLAIGTDMLGREDLLGEALATARYVVARERTDTHAVRGTEFDIVAQYIVNGEKLMLIKKQVSVGDPTVIYIKESNFEWVPRLQTLLRNEESTQRILMVSQGEPMNGLLGLFNCIRKEPGGQDARCYLILDETAPAFDPSLPLYREQISKDSAMNVYDGGQWGSYRHMPLKVGAMLTAKHAYINVKMRGDLSTLQWVQGHLDPYTFKPKEHEELVHVYYSALNFRDVMTSTGKIAAEVIEKNRTRQENVQGLEFSGRDSKGRRVMGEVISGALATMVVADTNLMWEVPDEWTLEDAATVPVVYATAYYALFLSGHMKRGDTVLVHAGTGGVGQAAIQLALHEGCTVFTTVGTQEKRHFIKERFPQLSDCHIGNSRDTSFEQLIMAETNGRGVDLVLNSLSGDKLLASVRCLALGGRFLEIGKFDLINNTPLGMDIFLKETSFHGVMLDTLFNSPPEWKKPLYDIMVKGIKEGAVRPLSRTVFADDEAEKAFRFMAAGKHIGKVLLKIRDEEKDRSASPEILLHEAKPRFSCDPECTFIIAGGLGGLGLELADWLVLRGARKLVLTSRSGLRTGYQTSRVRTWRSYGVTVQISTQDITTQRGVTSLLKEANKLGPVGAIFNLAVVLLDALFENQTEDNFVKSFGPKAEATKHFDSISRKLCPQLKHFVVFSSVSCGRGNAGQTNYGMSNSVMERICERRVREGYPGLAVQWGAVGEVGLVADMQEDDHELVIGGTLQQRISSCLEVLDGFLRQPHPVVASMVVAEKRAGGTGSANVVECITNIIGLRDLKTVSLHATLAELGMDSMMAIEIKQTLERKFELFFTPEDIRGLTFAKLIDLSNNETTVNKEVNVDGLGFMLQAFGDERDASRPTMVLPSVGGGGNIFLIPGIEGMASLFEPLAKDLKFKVTGLQLGHWKDSPSERASEMAKFLFPFVKDSITSKDDPFRLLGYSFGGLIAMQLALQLEEAGYHGKLFLVDSGPKFLQQIVKTQIEANRNENNLQINLLITILKVVQKQDGVLLKQVYSDLSKLGSWDERLKHFLTLVSDSQYSHGYCKSVATSTLRRIRAILSFDWPEVATLKSRVTLIRPTVQALQTDEDYGLEKFCEQPVDVQFVEGDHRTILSNPLVANLINTQLSTLVEDSITKEALRRAN